ncbi:malonic semialdehyde reductase [Nisaea sp.]|uniref:malonic semialdehyde reductase n=1 Tax=Nisaea sp. TaxID=2024842 RepID=UPI0032ED56C3
MNTATLKARTEIEALKARISQLDGDSLDLLFRQARTHNTWTELPVPDAMLHDLYEIVKMAPTANNGCPARYLFVRSEAAKERLAGCVAPGNADKVRAAPVTVIIGYDTRYFETLDRLFPHKPEFKAKFAGNLAAAETAAFRNSSLQGAFLILAARALGLDTGPMSGFNNAAVDGAFFAGTSVRSNFLCSLGYADPAGLFERLPRLDFSQACTLL